MNCFLFNSLELEDKEKILNLGEKVEALPSEELYRSKNLAILLSGTAKVFRLRSLEEKIPVRNISAGNVFGAASLFGEWKEGQSSIISTTECTVLYLPEQTFSEIIEEYPQVAINYIAFLSDKIRFLNKRIDLFSADSTTHALLEFLLSNCDNKRRVKLDVSVSELSKRIGIGRSSLYRALDTLEKEGKITRNKNEIYIK